MLFFKLTRNKFLSIVFSISVLLYTSCHVVFIPLHSAVMPIEKTSKIQRLCSRSAPPVFEDVWMPSQEVIDAMEREMPKILKMKATECCMMSGKVGKLDDYHYQYFGIVIKGQQLIYIKAINLSDRETDWERNFTNYCDGGMCCWGILYDPINHTFSNLAINGV